MEKIRTITQSANDIDRIEPLFYGLLLFSFFILMIILYCIFCCLQQKQLEDFSFIGNINQQLIDNDQSLLNLPKTKDKKIKLQRLSRDTESKFRGYTTDSFVKINLSNDTSSSASPINASTSSNSFVYHDLSNKKSNLSYPQFKQTNDQLINKSIKQNTTELKDAKLNKFNPISPLFKSDNRTKLNVLNPKTIDLFDASQRKVDPKLVASLRLKMINKLQSKKLKEKSDNHI